MLSSILIMLSSAHAVGLWESAFKLFLAAHMTQSGLLARMLTSSLTSGCRDLAFSCGCFDPWAACSRHAHLLYSPCVLDICPPDATGFLHLRS